MTNHSRIIAHLTANWQVFESLLTDVSSEEASWKPDDSHWSILQILCHLVDEEKEDFRTRVQHVLETPDQPIPPIDPQAWVTDRKYSDQDFTMKLREFLEERAQSVVWLNGLENPAWENTYEHPKLGAQSASHYLANWLAHDYLHIRQINRMKYLYLRANLSGESLEYAGNW